MVSYWFGDVEGERCMSPPQDTEALIQRVSSLQMEQQDRPLPDWQVAVGTGLFRDRRDYLYRLHLLCMELSARRMRERLKTEEGELMGLVRLHDAIVFSMNLIREQLSRLGDITASGADQEESCGRAGRSRMTGSGPIAKLVEEINRLERVQGSLMQHIGQRADRIAPNCSALLGGVIAGRLIERAGGLERLAGMPASSIQILGAEKALFAHLKAGCPPPKHGIIFQHRRLRMAPRACRGRAARTIAARIAIAARIDHFRGVPDEAFIRESERRIRQVLERL